MPQKTEFDVELNKTLFVSADRISERRANANAWYVTLDGLLVALSSGLASVTTNSTRPTWLLPLVGASIVAMWIGSILRYKRINYAKFKVIQMIEADLAIRPFTEEEKIYREANRKRYRFLKQFQLFASRHFIF